MTDAEKIDFIINGKAISVTVLPATPLLEIIRDQLHLTGTKCGCGVGVCGSCTVILNGRAVKSCTIEAQKLQGAKVETIEALSSGGELHPVQKAFVERHGAQCGFCTPGMIMSAKALLDKNPRPTVTEIKETLRGNLCRCTGYLQPIEAVLQASGQLDRGVRLGGFDIIGLPQNNQWIGKSVKKPGAEERVTGETVYTDDITNTNDMLFLAAKWSERAHAAIESIDYSRAEKMTGVVGIITANDIPGDNSYGKSIRDIPILADKSVLSYADTIALVVAESYDTAEAACDEIEVKYHDFEAIIDPRRALDSDAPGLRPAGNLLAEVKIQKGDISRGFDWSDILIEEEFTTVRVDHSPLEPEAAVAGFDGDGHLCVSAPTQDVVSNRRQIAEMLGVPDSHIRIIQPAVGGAFGKREETYAQLHVALAAHILKKPVRTVYSRRQTLKHTQKRHPVIISIRLGADNDGRLMLFEADVLCDTGPYGSWGEEVLRRICDHVSGPYRIPNCRICGKVVYTNNVSCGAMRGLGVPQAAFACESAMDMMAEKLGIDPIRFRIINVDRHKSKSTEDRMTEPALAIKTLEHAAQKANWAQLLPSEVTGSPRIRRGRGVALYRYGSDFGPGVPLGGKAVAKLSPEGRAEVVISSVEFGQGLKTALSQIAADRLGLKPSDITVIAGDSDVAPTSGAKVTSSLTWIVANTVAAVCDKLRSSIKDVASNILNTRASDVIIDNGAVACRSDPRNRISIPDVLREFRAQGRSMEAEAITEEKEPESGLVFGCQIAEVTVNMSTGHVQVDRIIACQNAGLIINPEIARGQIIGGLAMGCGYALMEDAASVGGRIEADEFDKYKIMCSTDIPEYDVILLENIDPSRPYSALSAGGPSTVGTAPAIINAIYDAIGVRIRSLPATPDKILAAIRNKLEVA